MSTAARGSWIIFSALTTPLKPSNASGALRGESQLQCRAHFAPGQSRARARISCRRENCFARGSAGIPAERIVFSGVGKKPDEIRLALEAGILMFNVESAEELQTIDRVAAALHKAAPVAIRVNPDVDAMTHDHITTGKKENKFGIPLEKALPVFRLAARLPRINLMGVHSHIGSQITSIRPYVATLERVLKLDRYAWIAKASRCGISI